MPNPYDAYTTAGQEISSTYEGRHITFPADYITHPTHAAPNLVLGKDPILVGGNIVGVAFSSASGVNDLIAIDTEGIWALSVIAADDWGDSAIARGDEIFINKTTCELSKIRNANTHQHFGYALTTAAGDGAAHVVAVKVHWDPDDAEMIVGKGTEFYASADNSFNFREYRYRSTGTGMIRGQYMALALNAATATGDAIRGRTIVEAVGVGTADGGHFGIEFDTDGTLTGLGVGLRGTFMQPNRAAFATIAGGMSELWAEGDASDFGAATMHSIHRFVMDGDAAGYATADNVFEFVNLSAVQYAANTDTPDHALRCIINGNVRYIMVSENQAP